MSLCIQHCGLYGSIMRGSRNFCHGGGDRGLQAQLTEKKHSDNDFLGISLLRFYRGVQ